METKLIGRQDIVFAYEDALKGLKKGQGNFLLLGGDTGTGKSHIIQYFKEYLQKFNSENIDSKKKEKQIYDVYVACKPPIGSFNIGTMEPLNTVSHIIKGLMNDTSITPEKRFAINVGMTLLACIPMIGEIPYAVKEISRDLNKFKSEQKTKNADLRSGAFDEYMEYLKKYLQKKPAVLYLDDFHWADAESVEFIWAVIQEILKLPILIIATYKNQEVEAQGLPLLSMLTKLSDVNNDVTFSEFALNEFTTQDVSQAAKRIYFEHYKETPEFEDWIFEHSHGVPSVVCEYLEYFSKYSPFDAVGNLVTNFRDNEFLPASIQQLFGQKLEELTEEERNLLSIASAEGSEITAVVIANLLNTDVLDSIKKLRAIQNKTGIIKSVGAKYKYGLKTTVYKFTQAHYQVYFENTLEYEESIALHSQVASFLKERYNNASEEMKQSLAPMIAAHSTAAEDSEQAEEMLMKSAETAKQYDSAESIKQAFTNIDKNEDIFGDQFDFAQAMENILKDVELRNNNVDISQSDLSKLEDDYLYDKVPEYRELRRMVVHNLLQENYSLCVAKIDKAFADDRIEMQENEQIQLLNVKAKALIELNELEAGEKVAIECLGRAKELKDPELQALSLNNLAIISYLRGNAGDAITKLEEASGFAMSLAGELQLLTLANISLTLKKVAPIKADKYFEKVKEQCHHQKFYSLEKDLVKIYNEG
jgi:hypothetical protein